MSGGGGATAGRADSGEQVNGASRTQVKARPSSAGLTRAGAKNGISSTAALSLSNASDESGENELEVPNIEPSPLPEGQAIFPHGILFLSAAPHVPDSSAHPAFERIEAAWSSHGARITGDTKTSLGEWLREDFFAYHKSLYENRPIYFPLSSETQKLKAELGAVSFPSTLALKFAKRWPRF